MNFAEINDITIRYETNGSGGTPIVFINSLGTNLHIWDDVVPHFGHVQTLRYDKRGHGLSDAPPAPYQLRDHTNDLLGLLDHLHLDKVILVGVSVGGMITLDFAAEHPERVQAMVLLDTAGKIGSNDSWSQRIDTLEQHGMAYLADTILDSWFAPDIDGTMRQAGHNVLTRTPLSGYVGTCAAIRDADLRPTLAALTMPALVLCGAQDVATQPQLVQELAESLPNATFQQIDQAGHLPCWEQPTATAETIKTFLNAQPQQTSFEAGMSVRRSVLGNAHVDRAERNKTDFDANFQRMITEFAWGTVWSGDTLTKRERHLLTIGLMAALGKEHELAMHIRATQNTGVTPEEVREVFHQVAVYAGVPAANRAFAVAKEVYEE